ncbi:hypothetical protein N2152v2_001088 [Parachlorella kessleri]
MAEPQDKKAVPRSVESLGWLSQSGVQPKKQRLIEGVSASSLVAFKSELYKVQQQQEAVKEGLLDPEELRQRRKGLAGLLERSNAGVAERDSKDRLEIKTTSDRAAEAYAALERKAQLYERLARGEAVDDDARFEVDFLLKEREAPAVDTAELAAYTQTGGMSSADMAQERERRAWEDQAHETMAAAERREEERERRRQVLDEVIDETEADKQRAAELKQRRQAAEQQKREKLKAAFLKKQLEAMKTRQRPAGKQQ